MARTMDIEVNADPIARPAWMSVEDFERLLDRFPQAGFEWSVTVPKPRSINPMAAAYQCKVAWDERWTIAEEDWLFYGMPCDREDDEDIHWTQEVDEYVGVLPSDDEEKVGGTTATPSWLDVECAKVPSHSRTRRYGVTDKQSRRDNPSHMGARDDYDSEGNRKVRQPKITAARSADHDQELDAQHREVVDKKHPGINSWWVEEVLATLKSRVRAHLYSNKYFCGLTLDEIFLLERLGSSLEQIKAEIEAEEVDRTTVQEPLADWERELLELGGDPVGSFDVVEIPQAPVEWAHVCTDECEFVYCPNDPHDRNDGSDDLDAYAGDWMMYIHSQDEGELLAEAFGGWGYKITNRP